MSSHLISIISPRLFSKLALYQSSAYFLYPVILLQVLPFQSELTNFSFFKPKTVTWELASKKVSTGQEGDSLLTFSFILLFPTRLSSTILYSRLVSPTATDLS